jgi:hypothetical protein
VQELATRLQTAANPGEALEIQKQIEQAKINTEAAVLGAIAADAREKGDTDRAAEAELALDRLLHPEKYAAAPVPTQRPVPQHN